MSKPSDKLARARRGPFLEEGLIEPWKARRELPHEGADWG